MLAILALIIIGAPLFYLTLLNSKTASAAWYSDSWHYRKKLTIDRTKVSGGSDLSNFPVLVSLTDAELRKAQSSGNDFLFTSSDGSTKLDHEIESFTQSSGTLVAWVRIPTLSASANTDIYMYYGNSNTADQSNKNGVWSNSYEDVYHLKEDPSGSSPQMTNSTSTASMDGVSAGTMTTSDLVTGKIGNALEFDGTDDYIESSSNSSITGVNSFSMSAWVNTDDTGDPVSNYWQHIALQLGVHNPNYHSAYFPAMEDRITFEGYLWGVDNLGYTPGSPINGQWKYVVGTYDGSTARLYVDGSLTDQTNVTMDLSAAKVNIGDFLMDPSIHGRYYKGKIDEVRISNTTRTLGWITTEYNNQNDPNSFFSAKGSEETKKGPVLYLSFNEGQGTIAYDSSPSKNNGTLGVGTSAPSWTTEDQCVSGKCLTFYGGSNSNVGIGSTTPNVQSVAFWVKPKTTTEPLALLDGGSHYISASGGTITATGFSSPVIYVNGKVSSTLTANSWQYVEVTTGTAFSSASMKIGTNGTTYLNGFIDEFKVYDYQRSAAEVKTDYNSRGSVKGVSTQMGGAEQKYLSDGLVGYWKMDEASGTLADASGNSNTGTWGGTGASHYTTGKYGNGGGFNGTDDYVNFSSINGFGSFIGNNSYTVSVWAKTASANTRQVIMGDWDAAGSNESFTLEFGGWGQPSNHITSEQHNSGNARYYIDSNFVYSANTWYHITVTTDLLNAQRVIYINGIQQNTIPISGTIITGDKLTFGRSGNYNGIYLQGNIDETRVYNRALSPKEVSDLYNWAPGPVGYWKMDDKVSGNNKTIVDSSGNGNNGTTNWGANASGMNCSQAPGKYGGGCQFDAIDDNILTSSFPAFSSNNFTIESWVYTSSITGNGQYIITSSTATATNCTGWDGSTFQVNWEGKATYTIRLSTGSNYTLVATSTVPLNSWVHLTAVYNKNSGNLILYSNGVPIATDASAPSTFCSNGSSLRIGGNESSGAFNGNLDDVKIYNYARTQKQIVSDMNGGHPAVGSPIGSAVGYWDFDEGYSITANNLGNGGSALNGTITGATWTNAGKFGKALTFGSSDNVSMGDVSFVDGLTSMTVSFWTNPSALGTNKYFVSKYTGPTGQNSFAIATNDAPTDIKVYIPTAISDWSTRYDTSNLGLTNGTFAHIVVVYDGTQAAANRVKVYKNGVLVSGFVTGTLPASMTSGSTSNLKIGQPDEADNYSVLGGLDEVKVYAYALTASEILTDYNHGSSLILGALGNNSTYQPQAQNQEYCVPGDATSCVAPVGEWKFEEGSGGSANDTSGNGNNGTLNNGPTWTTGKVGGGINFDGSNDRVTVATNSQLEPSYITIEFWTNMANDISSWARFIDKTDNTSTGYNIAKGSVSTGVGCGGGTDDDKLTFKIQTTNLGGYCVSSTNTVTKNSWNHVAATYDGSIMKIYLNGSLDNTRSVSGGVISYPSSVDLDVGDDYNMGLELWPFKGKMDDIKIFNYARTPAQIAWDFNKGKPVGWWRFDECSGATVKDYSGNANNGTITIGTGAGTGHQDSAGTCTDGTGNTAWNNGATGKRNYSLNLDGIDDVVSAGDSSSLDIGGNQITLSAWIKTSTGQDDKIILEKGGWQGGTYQLTMSGNTAKFNFYSICNEGFDTTTAVTDGNWHHIVGVYNGANKYIYLDGKISNTGSCSGNINTNNGNLTIGARDGGSNYFTGQIDDVKIWNFALTGTQIKNEYNGGAVNFGPVTGSP